MKFWWYLALGIFLLVTYVLVGWLFWLTILLIIIYVLYRFWGWFQRATAPPGKRIRHGMLRGHLEKEYGTVEGGKEYKNIVRELRKKGYR